MAVKVKSLREWDINQIIEGVGQPDVKVVIYFFSPSYEKYEIQKTLVNAFPDAVCIGSSMCGGWSSEGAIRTGVTIMSLSSDEVEETYVTFQEGTKKDPIKTAHAAISDLKSKTKNQNINPDEYLGIILFDGLCLGELIMKEFTMEKYLNLAFIGAAAADEMTFSKTIVGAGNQFSEDGLVAAILKMKIPFFFNHYVHFLPTAKSFTITRVEISRRIAWEINGEPAAEFYARQVGIDDVNKLTFDYFVKHPVGLVLGESVYIRSPNLVIDGKGLQFYCYIEAGTKVFLLEHGDIIANAQTSIQEALQFLPGIQGCLLFNCIQRYLELAEDNIIDDFNDVFNNYPMIGFNTYGEELFTHHNQTLTAVFFGTLPETGTADPYKAKRLFHYTNSKLKSLVFDIVSRSELLNITISYLKGSMDAEPDNTVRENYETIRKSLTEMIEQSNISKRDIEQMLVVYQNNVEKTGEYVFSIVDEIRTQNRRLVELRKDAEAANRTKSNFLANMSHEIRTPMNAIAGMTELLLRSNLSNEAKNYAQDIKQAGNNLLSIINDILDFSKIEAGRMELVPVKYLLASLINDTVNIIRTKVAEKPIFFYTNIDGQIPNCLIGDETRLRQILLNLLSNAAKFTEKGQISLSITAKKRSDKKVWLDFSVTDTGKGIKEEDQKKLFSDFTQVDMERNRNIEGTGLGLAITKQLCLLMDGTISLESEYGKGSVFTVSIPQDIGSPEYFAAVDNAAEKKVLVYEGRLIYAKAVCWSLENMGVPHTVVANIDDFTAALYREEWSFIFACYKYHDIIKKVMDKPNEFYPGNKKPAIALMMEWDSKTYISGVRVISLSMQTLSIANILNGKEDNNDYSERLSDPGTTHHTFPKARILVVDDILTNLKVVEGLMTPYLSKVDTCLSGIEAIELVKKNEYDIVFMDHMMPKMDGIEATTIIREWEKNQRIENKERRVEDKKPRIPIIALTANTVSGAREMYLEKDFDDFLPKPIDILILDGMLNKWIPKNKMEYGGNINKPEKNTFQTPNIDGIDIQKGIKMIGNKESKYYSILSTFHNDAKERLLLLQNISERDDLSEFIIHIHALKSASAAICAEEISIQSADLENASRKEDRAFIQGNLPKYIEQLSKMVEDINTALETKKAAENAGA